MTFIGKLLAFLNLIVGLGFVSFAATLYFQRPSWFEPIPEVVDKGNAPVTFAQLKQDTDNLGRSATAASAEWGQQLKKLEAVETRRADRLKEFEKRTGWMRKGNPADKGAAFYEHVNETGATEKSLIDHTKLGPAIAAIDGKPLQGVDNLGKAFSDDVDAVIALEKDVEKQTKRYDELGTEILLEEGRKLKMGDIRASVQSELFYLSTFEVNVYETRETVFRRKKQLAQRLDELSGK
jgi:hypothetical protein